MPFSPPGTPVRPSQEWYFDPKLPDPIQILHQKCAKRSNESGRLANGDLREKVDFVLINNMRHRDSDPQGSPKNAAPLET